MCIVLDAYAFHNFSYRTTSYDSFNLAFLVDNDNFLDHRFTKKKDQRPLLFLQEVHLHQQECMCDYVADFSGTVDDE